MARPPSNGPKTYQLKLGKSFDKRPEIIYNTMRFDFKPVSLGSSKDLTMDIGGENGLQVTATMAGKQGGSSSQSAQTVYKGSKKPYSTKECVLIVDDVTGEVTLERLGDNVQLKKARPEGSSKSNGNRGQSNSANSPQSSDKMDSSPASTAEYSPGPSASPLPSPSLTEPMKQHKAPSGKIHTNAPPPALSQARGTPIKPIQQSTTGRPSAHTQDSKQAEKTYPPVKPLARRTPSSSSSSSSSSGSSSSSSESEADEPEAAVHQNIDDILMDVDDPIPAYPNKGSSGNSTQKPIGIPVNQPVRSINNELKNDLCLSDESSDEEDEHDPLRF